MKKGVKKLQKLNEAFDNWKTGGGIFSVLQTLPVPWSSESIAQSLDFIYHGNRSGGKFASPIVNEFADGALTLAEKTAIAQSILSVFGVSWSKIYRTMSEQYDPIENYSMTETMTNDVTVDEHGHTITRTDELEHSKTGTETETPDTTETITPNTTTGTDNAIYGFNSTDPVPTGEQTTTETGTNTTTKTGTNEIEYDTLETDEGTQTIANTGRDTHTRNYTLRRSGNIGVTTSQQMLQSERDLWMWSFFYDVVFPDVDRVLTLPIY